MSKNRPHYDEEITKREYRTKEGATWAWAQVAMGKRVAITRWRWKWFPWFRIAGIISKYDGDDEAETPSTDSPERTKRQPLVHV